MLPADESPSGPIPSGYIAAHPSSAGTACSAALAASLPATAAAAAAPADGVCLADAAVQTPRLLMLRGASATVGPVASGTSTAAAATDDAADSSKPGAAALGDAIDMSPPHPSTPRQPTDGDAAGTPAKDCIVFSNQAKAGGSCSAHGPASSSAAADDDSVSYSTPAASLASASDDVSMRLSAPCLTSVMLAQTGGLKGIYLQLSLCVDISALLPARLSLNDLVS